MDGKYVHLAMATRMHFEIEILLFFKDMVKLQLAMLIGRQCREGSPSNQFDGVLSLPLPLYPWC